MDQTLVKIARVRAKSILVRSRIPSVDYCVNPYVGCAHGCRYCYATFVGQYAGHTEAWGTYVDIKANAPDLLDRALRRAPPGTIHLSTVTDPYQPVEAREGLTRACLEVVLRYGFPVSILTKSPLVLRDLDLLRRFPECTVGLTVTTDREDMRVLFEPGAPSLASRLEALRALKEAGLRTLVFVGPTLPMDPDSLASRLAPLADDYLVDGMNYRHRVLRLYRQHGLEWALDPRFPDQVAACLRERFRGVGRAVTRAPGRSEQPDPAAGWP